MIHFECQYCGRKLKVPETNAGKAGWCPQCRNRTTVPPVVEELALVRDPDATAPRESSECVIPSPSDRIMAAHLAQEAEIRRREPELLASLGSSMPTPEHTGKRETSWLLDILLYPFSITGMVALGLIIAYPLVRALAGALLFFMPFGGLASLVIGFVFGLYTNWYLAECVYDSAKGGTRAPDILGADTSVSALWSRVSYLAAVYILYAMPVVIYRMFMDRLDAIFWALLVWAILFLPMGLLAMVIEDSVSALNPLFLLGSILRVLVPYLGLLVCMAATAAAFSLIPMVFMANARPGALAIVGLIVGAYSLFIYAHILGRFYWRYRDRLDWTL